MLHPHFEKYFISQFYIITTDTSDGIRWATFEKIDFFLRYPLYHMKILVLPTIFNFMIKRSHFLPPIGSFVHWETYQMVGAYFLKSLMHWNQLHLNGMSSKLKHRIYMWAVKHFIIISTNSYVLIVDQHYNILCHWFVERHIKLIIIHLRVVMSIEEWN